MYDLNDFFLFSGLATAEKNKIISTFSQPVFFQKNSIIYDASHFEHALGIMMCGAATSFSGEVRLSTSLFPEKCLDAHLKKATVSVLPQFLEPTALTAAVLLL